MSDDPTVVIPATILIIALSAFFVASEFSLIATRRHRLEEAAPTSPAARAALRSASELTLLLAGAQLGITLCTLLLGAITKPAVHYWLEPLLEQVGLSGGVADVASFVLALFIVTFLHLVIGEMAPKSWAIAHPERSAVLLAIPMRGFMAVTRPLLLALNSAANRLLRRYGVDPVDSVATGQDPAALRHLVEHSANVGVLDVLASQTLATALTLDETPIRDLVRVDAPLVLVPRTATVADLQRVALDSGHRRIPVSDGDDIVGVVHVRDTLMQPPDAPVVGVMRPPYRLAADTTLHMALAAMRQTRQHLAVVIDAGADSSADLSADTSAGQPSGRVLGVVTLADVLRQLAPDGRPTPVRSGAR
jgi:CBS domain containing-hemolysin-like protein